ncbi:MAG: hypothetical protein NVS9B7_18870 [Flavisolibacter sp.]
MVTACDKTEHLPYYNKGNAPILSTSTTSIAPAPADSNSTALTLTWTDPKYATDTSNEKYVVEIDSAGRGFSHAVTRVVTGQRMISFAAKDLNNILLGYGFSFGVPYDMEIRVRSSYANNNELYKSNTVAIKMTPYKVPPKIPLPVSGRLYIVGDATGSSWNNPVDTPTQKFTRIDETTFGGVFQLTGGKEFLLLPINGSWGSKYSVTDKTIAGLNTGGDFGFNLPQNFPGPSNTGLYKIVVDFQHGKFTVTPYGLGTSLPDSLYIVGDATPGGWANPVPSPQQKFMRLNATDFEITMPLIGGKQYLLLPKNGDWTHKFSLKSNADPALKMGGIFTPDAPQNFIGPDAGGTYKVHVSFLDDSYTLTKQ